MEGGAGEGGQERRASVHPGPAPEFALQLGPSGGDLQVGGRVCARARGAREGRPSRGRRGKVSGKRAGGSGELGRAGRQAGADGALEGARGGEERRLDPRQLLKLARECGAGGWAWAPGRAGAPRGEDTAAWSPAPLIFPSSPSRWGTLPL